MEYEVEQGNAIDIVWDLPGVVDLPDGSITLDVMTSSVTLTFPDASTRVLRCMREIAINREVASGKVTALLREDDTSGWPLGDIGYVADFLFWSGEVCNRDEGTISVLPLTGTLKARPVRPWSLMNPLEFLVESSEQEERLAVCKGCPRFKRGVCLECGCVMKAKAKLARAACPLGHWGMSGSPVPNKDVSVFIAARDRIFRERWPGEMPDEVDVS